MSRYRNLKIVDNEPKTNVAEVTELPVADV